jgi:hypothetical protein
MYVYKYLQVIISWKLFYSVFGARAHNSPLMQVKFESLSPVFDQVLVILNLALKMRIGGTKVCFRSTAVMELSGCF